MDDISILTENNIPLDDAADLLTVCTANKCFATFEQLLDSGINFCESTCKLEVSEELVNCIYECECTNPIYSHASCTDIHLDSITKSRLDDISSNVKFDDNSVTLGPWKLEMTDDGTGTNTYNVSVTYCEDFI